MSEESEVLNWKYSRFFTNLKNNFSKDNILNVLPKNDGHPGPYSIFTTEYALYNLRRDPGEEYNVKELYPEIVKELENLAEIARNDLGDNLTKRIGNNIREPGSIE